MSESFARMTLWFAALVFGVHIGAAIYEMVVITPLWAGNPPQSVRGFNPIAEYAIEPLGYKLPAIAVLASVSFVLLAAASGKSPGRGWMLLAACVGLVLSVATVAYAFPILRATIVENGATLSDAQIAEKVHAWILWSRLRLLGLLIAWTASVIALVRRSAKGHRFFSSDLRFR